MDKSNLPKKCLALSVGKQTLHVHLLFNFLLRIPFARFIFRFFIYMLPLQFPCAKFMDTFHLHAVFERFILHVSFARYIIHLHVSLTRVTCMFRLRVSLAHLKKPHSMLTVFLVYPVFSVFLVFSVVGCLHSLPTVFGTC